ncbi:MAG TPA: DUF3147 family protein [Candidatus Acidoferrum sp.]|jgi:hypothetical protein
MVVKCDFGALKQTKPHEYAMRFIFGGVVTVLTGLIAKEFGPGIGGLFLAFPAIFPASATLLEKHQRKRKERLGLHGAQRARLAVGVDAAGAAMGTCGLLAFAVLVWATVESHNAALVLIAATMAWLAVAILVWKIRKAI